MAQKTQTKTSATREDRLKAALKANLARRKAQSRVRRNDTAGEAAQEAETKKD